MYLLFYICQHLQRHLTVSNLSWDPGQWRQVLVIKLRVSVSLLSWNILTPAHDVNEIRVQKSPRCSVIDFQVGFRQWYIAWRVRQPTFCLYSDNCTVTYCTVWESKFTTTWLARRSKCTASDRYGFLNVRHPKCTAFENCGTQNVRLSNCTSPE